jgi:hypothetical protein
MVKKLREIKKEIEDKEREEKEKEVPPIPKEKAVEFPDEFRIIVIRTIDWTFNILAKRLGEHWKLDPDELTALGNSYIALAEKYLPEGANRFSVEINVVLWTGIIILKRVALK